jgi:hypothetical protein
MWHYSSALHCSTSPKVFRRSLNQYIYHAITLKRVWIWESKLGFVSFLATFLLELLILTNIILLDVLNFNACEIQISKEIEQFVFQLNLVFEKDTGAKIPITINNQDPRLKSTIT